MSDDPAILLDDDDLGPTGEGAELASRPEVRLARASTVWARNGASCPRCGGPVLAATYNHNVVYRKCRDCPAVLP